MSLEAEQIDPTAVDADMAERIRASFLIAGPLLARFRGCRDADCPAAT